MHVRHWATTALAVTGLVVTLTTPATADDATARRTVKWSATHQTSAASGERWIESGSTPSSPELVLSGTLSNTGSACYSLWTRFRFDRTPGPVRKHAEICGRSRVEVKMNQAYQFITSGYVAVCEGTENPDNCGPWENITSWPVNHS